MQTGRVEFAGTKRFQVMRRLGAGGMGVVYDALDRDRNVRVALKTLKALDGERILRFKNEFRSLADLQHPNLVSLGELFEEEGQWFFTMELVRGQSFLKWVRPEQALVADFSEDEPTQPGATLPDEARLRAALSQLAGGLAALHAAGKVHRDIKPSNIMVTAEGRVVLLDFGLVTEIVAGQQVTDVNPVGTTSYMAPEQAASKPVGAEADWYSVGVLLYQALTGQLPFQGSPLEILMDKQKFEPPPPRAVLPEVPRDLDALCAELLRFDPKQRPAGREVLRRLGVRETSVVRATTQSSLSQTPPFIGRQTELRELRAAFDAARIRAVTMFVAGESGVGKSTLVRRFTEQLTAEDPNLLVFTGRCYERESVPYKAFDGIIDALSRHMSRLPPVEAAALLPLRAGLLAQVFPVLRRVPAIAEAPRPQYEALDPQELRSRIFAGIRELLYRLAERHPLVLVTDDVQWADRDSWALLGEIMRPPDAPTLLLVATARAADPAAQAALSGDVRRLQLGPLGAEEARELAGALVERAAGAAAIDPATLAAEAAGHPLFIDELVRHAALSGARTGAIRLEEALWSRIERLEGAARQLLEMVVVASAPLPQDTARRAVDCDFAAFNRLVAVLRVANLVRTGTARETIEPYHDRVRDSVSSKLSPDQRRFCHERLALAFEAATPADPQSLALHWEGAGAIERAAQYAVLAADRAAEALAFDRAAELYRKALELSPDKGEPARRLRARLGHALANGGRGAQAAEAYLLAAEGANEAEALDLRRRAAEQLLRAGHVDEGLTALEHVLAAVNMRLPRTPRRALASLILRRVLLALRGTRFRERDPSQIAANELMRVDICWSVAATLTTIDPIRGFDFGTRHLLLALRAGEPSRIATALLSESAIIATSGERGDRRGAPLLERARELAEKLDQPYQTAMVRLHYGVRSFLAGEWKATHKHCDEAERLFRERCTGVAREVGNAQLFGCSSLYAMGELDELCRRVSRGLQEAFERGDLTSAAEMRTGLVNLAWLVQEGPKAAREHTSAAIGQWSQRGFHLQHAYDYFAQTTLDLYEGNISAAQERVERYWPAVSRSLVLRIQPVRIFNYDLVGRCALASAIERNDAKLFAATERYARRILREKRRWAQGLATLLRAGITAARHQPEQAQSLYRQAADEFEASDMRLYAAVARRRAGLVKEADTWMAGQRIREPSRITAILAPGR